MEARNQVKEAALLILGAIVLTLAVEFVMPPLTGLCNVRKFRGGICWCDGKERTSFPADGFKPCKVPR